MTIANLQSKERKQKKCIRKEERCRKQRKINTKMEHESHVQRLEQVSGGERHQWTAHEDF